MRKSILKKAMILMSCAIISTVTISLNASATTVSSPTVDNDTDDPNCSFDNSGFTYMNGNSNLYCGDARYSNSSYSNRHYTWIFPNIGSTYPVYFNITVSPYLAYSGFTDPAAVYSARYYYNTDITIGTLDQDAAPNGFSSISKYSIHTLDASSGVYCDRATVKPSGYYQSTKYTGADAVTVTVSY